jgi:hypothetical protein
VVAIVPTADRGKATIKVRVAMDKKDARIVPDMGVRVSFLGPKASTAAQAPEGVLVPAQAIAQRDGKSMVFVVEAGKAAQRSLAASAPDFGALKLLPQGTVKVGDRVILSPPPALHDGASITIEEPR